MKIKFTLRVTASQLAAKESRRSQLLADFGDCGETPDEWISIALRRCSVAQPLAGVCASISQIRWVNL
jgi:hypothetical protein